MAVTIAAVMRRVHNFFQRGWIDGDITLSGGVVTPAVDAPYICIEGSAYSDGVHRMVDGVAEGVTRDEIFSGRVWLLHPPDDFVQLAEAISAYDDKRAAGGPVSETFGSYGYTMDASLAAAGWPGAFAAQLRPYMRMYTEVRG